MTPVTATSSHAGPSLPRSTPNPATIAVYRNPTPASSTAHTKNRCDAKSIDSSRTVATTTPTTSSGIVATSSSGPTMSAPTKSWTGITAGNAPTTAAATPSANHQRSTSPRPSQDRHGNSSGTANTSTSSPTVSKLSASGVPGPLPMCPCHALHSASKADVNWVTATTTNA